MKISNKFLMLGFFSFLLGGNGVFAADDVNLAQDVERRSSSNTTNPSSAKKTSDTTRRSNSSRGKTSSSSSRKSSSSTKTTVSSSSTDFTKEDCASKYILGLDRECYNVNTVQSGGVYADCSDNTVADYYDIMDMQLASVVGIDKFSDYKTNCEAYKSYALEKWLSSKNVIETSAVKGSDECVFATKRLTAAKKCYTAALSHDGNFFEFSDLMTNSCGEFPDVANKFSKAGDLGLANIPEVLENYSTLQFTNKAENWRSSVEAVLAGYVYDARQACGEETYELLELNKFTEDKRENLLTSAKESFYDAAAENLGRRASNSILYGKPTVNKVRSNISASNSVAGSISNGISGVLYQNPDEGFGKKYDRSRKGGKDKDFGNVNPQLDNINSVGNIFVIEGVSSINSTRARLVNIIATGDTGIPESQDAIDVAIIQGLGGRAGVVDSGIYGVIGNLVEGDVFVIKQSDKTCQILMLNSDGGFDTVSAKHMGKSLKDYMNNCSKVAD